LEGAANNGAKESEGALVATGAQLSARRNAERAATYVRKDSNLCQGSGMVNAEKRSIFYFMVGPTISIGKKTNARVFFLICYVCDRASVSSGAKTTHCCCSNPYPVGKIQI
jgi:hypothetical protein